MKQHLGRLALLVSLITLYGPVAAWGQSYNKLKAVTYALAHASEGQGNSAYNPSFFDPNECLPFGANIPDCTDFVSQCMWFGGQQQVKNGDRPYASNSNWYFDNRGYHGFSHSWDNAQDLLEYLRQSGRGFFISPRSADPGDILFADWGDGKGITHSMIYSKNDGLGNPALTQHSENRLDKPLSKYISDNPKSSYYCYHLLTSDKVEYQAHTAYLGWMDPVADQAIAGTTGRGIRMEAVRLLAPERNIFYQAHVACKGWLPTVRNGEVAGTTNLGLQMEAIRITVSRGHVFYRAHVAFKGWLPWVQDGAIAGTTGQGIQMEALQVYITD